MKKVLVVGPRFFHYNKSIANAFQRKDYEVSVFEYDEPIDPGHLLNRVLFYFFPKFMGTKNKLKLNAEIYSLYQKNQPDCILFIKGSILNSETLKSIKTAKYLWMMDSFAYYKTLLNIALEFDHIFCFEKSDVDIVLNYSPNVSFLPLAVDTSIYNTECNCLKDIDILFVGTLYPNRFEFFLSFIKRNPKLRIKIVGPVVGVRNKLKGFIYSLKYPWKLSIRKISPENVSILMQRSKIVLNIHHEQSVYGVNPRFFEIISCGAIQVVDRKEFTSDYFSNYEISQFDRLEEIEPICNAILQGGSDYYRHDIKLITAIKGNHSFDNRVNEIINVMRIKAHD